MQDNIRVTAPIHSNESSTKLRPSKEAPVLNPVDPTKVNSQNTSENTQGSKNDGFSFLLNHGSVFNKFIQQLTQTPGLSQTLKKIMFDAFIQDGKIAKLSTVDSLIAELSEKLKMNPQEIVEALKYQNENQTKFSGEMFDEFRQLLKESQGNKEFEQLVGKFLKAYNGFFSSSDTLKAIIQNLKNISMSMPKTYSSQLNELINKLIINQPTNSLDLNLITLKNEIIPFLSSYISKTNDFGIVRDTITLLINNIARLNTSSKEDVVNKFIDILDYSKYHFNMSDEKINLIKSIFANEVSNENKPQNEMFNLIMKLLSEGTGKDQSSISRSIYKDITNSLLLDNSVFMPLTHLFLPVNYNGTFMFSEIWIDKDSNKKNTSENASGSPATKLFVTFDIKGLGYFETTIWLSDMKADIEVSYPSSIENKDKDIRNNIARILTDNGISLNSMVVTKGQPPKKLQEVFENFYDRRRSIDVTI